MAMDFARQSTFVRFADCVSSCGEKGARRQRRCSLSGLCERRARLSPASPVRGSGDAAGQSHACVGCFFLYFFLAGFGDISGGGDTAVTPSFLALLAGIGDNPDGGDAAATASFLTFLAGIGVVAAFGATLTSWKRPGDPAGHRSFFL